jgi:hypothetical protein
MPTAHHADASQMELKMKAICEGRKTRQEVTRDTINQYRAVYVRTQQRLNVLKEVCVRKLLNTRTSLTHLSLFGGTSLNLHDKHDMNVRTTC